MAILRILQLLMQQGATSISILKLPQTYRKVEHTVRTTFIFAELFENKFPTS